MEMLVSIYSHIFIEIMKAQPISVVSVYLIIQMAKLWLPKMIAGGRLNKKDGLTRYGDSHVKDKTS